MRMGDYLDEILGPDAIFIPSSRGAKTVEPDVYEGPDVNPSTGTYTPFSYEGPDVGRETGEYIPPSQASRRTSAPASSPAGAASSGFPWLAVAAGVVAVATVAVIMFRGRR